MDEQCLSFILFNHYLSKNKNKKLKKKNTHTKQEYSKRLKLQIQDAIANHNIKFKTEVK